MIEQNVVEARQKLDALLAKQNELNAQRRLASFTIMRCSNAIIWEKAKQRYRHWLDQHGMRTILLIGMLFSSLVLPLAFVVAIFNNLMFGIIASLLSVTGSMLIYSLVLCGSDEATSKRVASKDREKQAANRNREQSRVDLELVDREVQATLSQLSVLEPELAKQRAAEEAERQRNAFTNLSKILHNERWKELRGVEFEEFVARVFQHLGYKTEDTPTTGDQGVDLIAIQGNRRIAIQIKGYFNSVSNSAIQEVVAGKQLYSCSETCVVTNSRFTKSAIELADANNCRRIDEHTFEDFIYGRLFKRIS